MVRRLVKDESGVALGLAIIMIVLIGVMGAGLLVFVRNDLEAVVEVNQGEKAFNIADAGAQAARQQLLIDKIAAHYDVDSTSSTSYYGSSCNKDSADPGESIARNPAADNWSPEAGGVTKNFADGQFNVTIRWLSPITTADSRCVAPQTGTLPSGVDYYKVISTGTYGNAQRRVEAIYSTYNLDVPRAYFTPGNITISGTAKIQDVSLFSLSNITVNGGAQITGTDLAYGDWNDPPSNRFNTTARATTAAGLGAVGQITGSSSMGTRDFDVDSSPIKFIKKDNPETDPQTASQITFPFDYKSQLDTESMCEEAKRQGNYTANGTSGNASLSTWPTNSSYNTVVCYEFTNTGSNHTLTWNVNGNTNLAAPYDGCKGPIQEGTLVIKGGAFTTKSNTALFRGVVVVRGPAGAEVSDLGSSSDTGNTCLDGFINASGTIKIAGTVRPSSSTETSSRPGFYGVRQWSWREMYE
jgi:hypothetical protein